MSQQRISRPKPQGLPQCWPKGRDAGCDRISQGVTILEWPPSFQIFPDAKIFALGSCFARNVERALLPNPDNQHAKKELISRVRSPENQLLRV
ncbi:hypothetical protein [Acaryochloris sp. IP29b_bin.148]|uniref:hypothetical protein n=1 Tax=Acaryochloris sp. IP29b_bin.148 TaxID=2969218 RepID=UPI00260FE331|nr:hypothetical protein [Acaryochloris sp. IP29b_bin.148]